MCQFHRAFLTTLFHPSVVTFTSLMCWNVLLKLLFSTSSHADECILSHVSDSQILGLLSSPYLSLEHRTITIVLQLLKTHYQGWLNKGLTGQQYPLQHIYLHHGASTLDKGSKPWTTVFVVTLWSSSCFSFVISPISASVNISIPSGLLTSGSEDRT